MAGHSQFKNIMHRKGKQDAVRAKLFSKLSREITVAAKSGLPDPQMNPRLRAAILAARAENVPRDNIERAIKKSQMNDGEVYEEIRYEGYGPGGIAMIVEAMTNNRNRTASDIRSIFSKSGGNLAETGAVSFLFSRTGLLVFPATSASEETFFEAALEAGSDDFVPTEDAYEIHCPPERLGAISRELEEKFGEPTAVSLAWRPLDPVLVDDASAETLLNLKETLEDHDDVQNVVCNFTLSEAMIAKLSCDS